MVPAPIARLVPLQRKRSFPAVHRADAISAVDCREDACAFLPHRIIRASQNSQ
ncbi:protein of unknown function (plasmid) [Caballeronia sp. S22]